MHESESKNEKPKEGCRFSQEQYDFLKQCSEKGEKGIKGWNEWRKKKDEDILLEGADFHWCYLKEILLSTNTTLGVHGKVYLKKAIFLGTHLENADLRFAHLECANFNCAHLEDTDFSSAHLQGAYFMDAHLEHSKLNTSNMGSTKLHRANIRGANLNNTNLQGAEFLLAIVDGSTLFWHCKVSRYSKNVNFTDFRGVALVSVRIDPATRQLLEYNSRRMNWDEWYKEHFLLRWPVWLFWLISDYGLRTWRIIVTFFGLATAFGVVYWLCPSCVIVMGDVGDIRGFWHALYFSVVTMTTLGFGDIAANPDSWVGQTLLMLQVILGYILLGALVTRFAVLFTAGGPAGKFANGKEKKEG